MDARLRALSDGPTMPTNPEAEAGLLRERAVTARVTSVLAEMTQVLGVRRASLIALRQLSPFHRNAWNESIAKFDGFKSEPGALCFE